MLGESVRRRQPRRRRPRAASQHGPAFWIGAALAVIAIPLAFGYAFAVLVLFPQPEVEAAGIPVPSIVGRTAAEAERALAQAGLGGLELTEQPSPAAAAGVIIAQSPLAGQQLRSGGNVRAAVSTGPARIRVPDVLGQAFERADAMLRSFGFTVTRVDGESEVAAGRVFALEPPAGGAVQLPATITVRVSTGPPVDSLAVDTLQLDTVPPDTLPPPVR